MSNQSPSEAELRSDIAAVTPVMIATEGKRRGLLGDETVEALVQLFTRYSTARTLAVIGEDDKNNDFPASNFYKHTVGRNQLRAEQRQLLEQEGGEELKWASTS